jgi:hypothetical protein
MKPQSTSQQERIDAFARELARAFRRLKKKACQPTSQEPRNVSAG